MKKRSHYLLIIPLFTLIGYFKLLNTSSVSKEINNEVIRLQTGFGKSDWSLTDYGINIKNSFPELSTTDLLLRAGFNESGVEKIWTKESITLAGVINVLFYLTCFLAWTVGFAFLAKDKSNQDK